MRNLGEVVVLSEGRVLDRPSGRLYAHAVESGVEEGAYAASVDDTRLVASLRAGDEQAFMDLVQRYGPSMLRVAMLFVRTRAVAEEVVQDLSLIHI